MSEYEFSEFQQPNSTSVLLILPGLPKLLKVVAVFPSV